jgi:UDP-GlcNAc:undecaprenyl-phosphate GlcNAc-1-phosphate transferase
VWIPFVGRLELGISSIPLTVAWIVMLCNSINLIDGLDGLATGVAAIGGGFLGLVGILWNIPHVAVLGAAICGVCLGFLRYNYPPARIFMGDSGSLLLGFCFAVASVSVPIKTLTAISMALPLLAVWFPLFELVSSTGRRILAGRSPMKADHGHWHHMLLRAGWSNQRIIWTYYAIALGCGMFVPALRVFDRYLVLPVFVAYCVLVIGYLSRHAVLAGKTWKQNTRERPVEHARI